MGELPVSPALAIDGKHTLSLRPYQEEALEAIDRAEARGVRRQLGVAATGLGKTVIFCAEAARRNLRTLVVAHRDELIQQAVEKVRLWWPDADVGVVKAERNEWWAQDVVVASVQSLNAKRLARLGDFGLVVVDEAHHASAPSYRRILDTLGCGPSEQRRPDGPLLLGVTATPDRADGKGLDQLFDQIIFNYDLLWGIRAGYLCDVRAVEVMLENLDLSNVTVRQGDYAEGELGAALTEANAPRHIVKAWKEHASDRLTLVFMPTVANAQEVAAEFAAAGIAATSVHGGEPLEERRAKMRGFAEGRYQVLTNCMVATEGFDLPAISCVVMGRPTKSRGLFVQMLGRGTRPYPGKADLLALDVVGVAGDKNLCSVPSLFGMTKRQMGAKGAARAVADIEAARDAEIARMAKQGVAVDGRLVAKDIDLFRKVQEQGRVAWASLRAGGFAVSMGDATVMLDPKGDDLYNVVVLRGRSKPAELLLERVPLALAQGAAEDHIRKNTSNQALVAKNATWRRRAPSPKQLDAAKKWGVAVDPKWNAGQVSDAISARVAETRRPR